MNFIRVIKAEENEKIPAIEYRDYHTALHHLILFNTMEEAQEALEKLEIITNTDYTDSDEYMLAVNNALEKAVNDIEVDYRTIHKDPDYEIINFDVFDLY